MRLFMALNFDDPVKPLLLEAHAEIRARSLRNVFAVLAPSVQNQGEGEIRVKGGGC
jgi:hypothetical protein